MPTLQSVENVLKDVYLGVVSHQLDCCADVVLSKLFETREEAEVKLKEMLENE